MAGGTKDPPGCCLGGGSDRSAFFSRTTVFIDECQTKALDREAASFALLWTKEGSYVKEESMIRSNIKAYRRGMTSLAPA